MPHQIDKVYEFAPLTGYSLKERSLIRLADYLFFIAIRILGSTSRVEVRGIENFEAIEAANKLPIYSFWHNRILLGTYIWRRRGIVVMTSQSFDGEYIARFIQRLGYGAIRGSSSRGGSKALVKMIKGMRNGMPMGFSVDGPRGPKYIAKPGPVLLAKKTGNPMMPFIVEPRSFWTVNSWDSLQIPMPFTKVLMVIGEPIYVDADADDDQIESKLGELQRALDDLTSEGEKWRLGR